jgi:phosphotransferase system  glucose/maltose/N-acetylglucosamine-specific IIC component
MVLTPLATETPLLGLTEPLIFTVTAKPPVVLLKMK